MQCKVWYAIAVFGSFLLLGSVHIVHAQSVSSAAATGDQAGLEDIVVTARRTEERSQDVPESIIAVTAADLQTHTVQKL